MAKNKMSGEVVALKILKKEVILAKVSGGLLAVLHEHRVTYRECSN